MNPTKTLLTLLICFLPLSVSADELDGRCVVCSELDGDDVVGFRFEGGYVNRGNRVREYQLEYQIETFGEQVADKTYRQTRTDVIWWNSWQLDRRTLLLNYNPDSSNKYVASYQCEVEESLDGYHQRLESIKSAKQKQLEADMEQNKI